MVDSTTTVGAVPDDPVPVTVISGVLGAGKTTLLNHLLSNPGDRAIGVIVNDVGEVNVDAALLERESGEEGIVDLSNGCVCCGLQGELVSTAVRLATDRDRRLDAIVLEASGVSEPLPVVRTLTGNAEIDADVDPTRYLTVGGVVAVVDSFGFWKEFDPDTTRPDGPIDPDRPLASVLVDSIEYSDRVVLNKCDLVPEDRIDRTAGIVRTLNPDAPIHRTVDAEIDADVVLDGPATDLDTLRRTPGWKQAIRDSKRGGGGSNRESSDRHEQTHDHEHEHGRARTHEGTTDHHDSEDGRTGHHDSGDGRVQTFVYRRDRPFAPGPLADRLAERDSGVLRVKGVCTVAGTDSVIGVSRAGEAVRAGAIGSWDGPPADRRTELVVIGVDLDRAAIEAAFDACLAGDDSRVDVDPFPIADP
ncbi:MAG: CobW family GTP-binding protein [Halobacteriota archaeon]